MELENSKPKLIILSDLWGKEKSFWLENYTKLLAENFNITFYDCCELGEINKTDYSEKNLHQQFLHGGIEKAVEKLVVLEKSEVYILAFSIGGFIAWKAALSGLKTKGIFAISSTRLRYEKEKPSGILELFFAEKDEFKPNDDWFETLNIEQRIFKNENHECYQKPEIAKEITDILLTYL